MDIQITSLPPSPPNYPFLAEGQNTGTKVIFLRARLCLVLEGREVGQLKEWSTNGFLPVSGTVTLTF